MWKAVRVKIFLFGLSSKKKTVQAKKNKVRSIFSNKVSYQTKVSYKADLLGSTDNWREKLLSEFQIDSTA